MTTRRLLSLIILLGALALLFPENIAQGETKITYLRTVENYVVPDVTLVNQDGKKVQLRSFLDSEKPVVMDFIYTTCTTIGPMFSMSFCDFQKRLGPEADKVQLVSISTDPLNDTPKVLKAYLQRYDAKPGWEFLTGTREDVDKVLKAFKAYSANKVSHPPLILLKSPSDNRWVRLYGLIETRELIREYQKVLK